MHVETLKSDRVCCSVVGVDDCADWQCPARKLEASGAQAKTAKCLTMHMLFTFVVKKTGKSKIDKCEIKCIIPLCYVRQ